MIISKAGKFKTLRFFGVLCAIVMGFMTLVGTSEDDAKDLVDIDFNANAEFELEPVTVEKVGGASIQATGDDCDTLTINEALAAVEDEIDDLDQVDIENVQLEYVEASYSDASWTPAENMSLSCSLTITGSQDPITIAETVINGASGEIDVALTTDQIEVINHYLRNRNEEFTYCVACDDTGGIDTYTVTYYIDINVSIDGTI